MRYILAIDQSTSATKSLLYDENGHVLDKIAREHRQIYPQPGWVEHDAEEIWQNTLAVMQELARRNTEQFKKAVCLSLTNQRETIVVFDRSTGRPLYNAPVWQCRRGDPLCRELAEAGHGGRVTELTGLRLDTYFSASKLAWLIHNQPEIRAKLASGEALIGTVDTYLIYRLTGGKVFATDYTNASRTLLFDINKLRWDEWLCALFTVPSQALPEVRQCSAQFGMTTIDGLLPNPLPICGVMGDSQASLFAQRCYQPGMAKVTFGTGSSVLLNIGSELRFSAGGAVSTLAWVYKGRPTYCFEGIINYSAATVAWLKEQLGLISSAKDAESLAAAVPDNGGVYLVPAFAGLSAPYWSPTARAAIVGLTAHSGRNHIVRAAEESIAYQLRDVLDMMKTDSGVTLQCIYADGGPTSDRFLMQFTADVAGLEIRVSDVPDCSPLGAVMAGMLGAGLRQSLDELEAAPRDMIIYQPTMPADQVECYYAGWKAAVQRVL
jgi:glycerol kinase